MSGNRIGKSGRSRVVIEGVQPEIDCGQFPIKRVAGESVVVSADVFGDGHDRIACRLLYRKEEDTEWQSVEMEPLGNDRWHAAFAVPDVGRYRYTIEGWVDRFRTWHGDLLKRIEAAQDISVDVMIGVALIEAAGLRASDQDRSQILAWAQAFREAQNPELRKAAVLDNGPIELVLKYPDRTLATVYGKELGIEVDRKRAGYSAWYELFPRSCSQQEGEHGTLRDIENWLPYVSRMGFDVLYLPPIHPIGSAFRKGKNNVVTAEPGDVGSPWGIGSTDGGHKSIHPQLGTMDDFHRLMTKANESGIELALDIAFQCSPDHPYVREHPEWFRKRPDGTIQYAENPPKKYQDIYPIDFETENWEALWWELASVFQFWIDHGVRIFRVDNPHTKAFPFWEWVIREIKGRHPDVLFLSEAFARPRLMYRLAKLGFSQSYTYFSWRNTKYEIENYFTELTQTEIREFFRPTLWPNTPDILPEYLQTGGRPAFQVRLVLAATLGANYGIYGPAFELCENAPRGPGSEEYLNSEKYEIKHRNLNSEWSLKDFIARVNQIRRDNPALHSDRRLRFHQTDNPLIVCYSKTTEDRANAILTVVNLDVHFKQTGWVTLDLEELGLDAHRSFQAHDLLGNARYLWQGHRNYVELVPHAVPAHIFLVRARVHSEKDFDYFM